MAADAQQTLVLHIDGESKGAQEALLALVDRLKDIGAASGPAATGLSGISNELIKATTIGNVFADVIKSAFHTFVSGIEEATTALPELISKVAEAGDKIWVMSQQTGVSAEALSKFDYVATQTGTTLETITNSIFQMQRRIGENTGAVSDALQRLGLDAAQLAAAKPEDIFTRVVTQIGKLPSATEKAQVGWALFGRQFRSIAQLTTQDMQGLMDKAQAMGLVTTKAQADMANAFTDAEDDMKRAFSGMEQHIAYALMPAFTSAIEGIAQLLVTFTQSFDLNTADWGARAKEFADTLITAFGQILEASRPFVDMLIRAFGDALKTAIYLLGGLAKAVGDTAEAISKAWGMLPGWVQHLIEDFGELAVAIGLVTIAANLASAALGRLAEMEVLSSAVGGLAGAFKLLSGALSELPAWIAEFGLLRTAAEFLSSAFESLIAVIPGGVGGLGVIGGLLTGEVLSGLVGGSKGFQSLKDGIDSVTGASKKGADGLHDIALAAEHAVDFQLTLVDAIKKGTAEILFQSITASKYADAQHAVDRAIQNTGVSMQDWIDLLRKSKDEFDVAIKTYNLMPDAVKRITEAEKEQTAATDALAKAHSDAAKTMAAAQSSGIGKELAQSRISEAEDMRQLNEQLARNEIKSQEDFEKQKTAIQVKYSAERKAAVINYERTTQQELAVMYEHTAVTLENATKEGQDLAIAQIQEGAAKEIAARQTALINPTKQQIEDFEKQRAAIELQAEADISALRIKANRDAEKSLQAAAFAGEQARIKIQETGIEQEIDLNKLSVAQQQVALDEKKLDAEAYYKELTAIYERGEAANSEIVDKYAKENAKKMLQYTHDLEVAQINATATGVQKQIAIENANYNFKIAQMQAEGKATEEMYQHELELHQMAVDQILVSEHNFTGQWEKDAELRGFHTKEWLDADLRAEEGTLREMLANEKQFTAAEIAEQKKRVLAAKAAAGDMKAAFVQSLGQIPGLIVNAFTGGGGLSGAVSAIGSMMGSNLLKSLGDTLTKNMSGMLGDVLSQIIPGLGAVIGPLITALFNIGGPSKQELAGRDTAKQFEDAIIATLSYSQKLEASLGNLKGGTERWKEVVIGVRDGYLQAGHTAAEAEDVVKRLWEAEKQGPEAVKAVQDEIQQILDLNKKALEELPKILDGVTGGLNAISAGTIGVFNKAVQDINDTGDQLVQLHEKEDTLKADIADLNKKDHLTDKQKAQLNTWQRQLADVQTAIMETAAKQQAAQKVMNDAAAGGQAAFDRMGRLAMTAFSAALAGGKTFLEAIDAIGPTLDDLIKAQQKFGFTSSETLNKLLSFKKFATDNKELAASIDGVNQMMKGLHMMGRLSQQDFDDLNSIASETFNKMVAQGVDGNTALQAMQPTLQTIWEMQQKYGLTVDANTQALLDQAKQQGIVGEDMKSTEQQVLDVLKAIAKALGADIPGAADKARDSLAKIPKEVNVDINANYNGPDFQMPPGGFNPETFGAQTEGIPSFEGRPIERVTGAGFALLHPGDVVGVPQPSWRIPQQQPANAPKILVIEANHKELARVVIDGLIEGGQTMNRFRTIVRQSTI